MDWELQSVGCVVFVQPVPTLPTAYAMWQDLTGSAPESFQAQGMGSQAAALLDGLSLTFSVQPQRFDLLSAPVGVAESESIPSGPPSFSDPAVAIEKTVDFAKKLIARQNPMRVALILNCVKPANSIEEATRQFGTETSLQSLPAGATDLQFALNVRRPVGNAGWEMNRLCRWSVSQFVLVQVQLGNQLLMPSPVNIIKHSVALNIDVNTTIRPIPLGPAQAASSLDSLVQEARIIMKGGYNALVSST